MTLIASVLTPRLVAQVSDRRLSLPDGAFVSDIAVKAVNVTCLNGRFSIAYTGLGVVQGMRTDLWVVDYLGTTKAASMPVQQITEGLTATLQAAFSGHPHLPLGLVLVGYLKDLPFIATVSNFIRAGVQLKSVFPEFALDVMTLQTSDKDAVEIQFYGMARAITPSISTKLKSLRRRRFFRNAKPLELMDRLVSIVREASNTPGCQPFVGKDCLAVAIPQYDDPINCDHAAASETSVLYSPHIVHPAATMADIQLQFSNPLKFQR